MHNDESGPVLNALGVGSPASDKFAFAIESRHDCAHWCEIYFDRIVVKAKVCDGAFRRNSRDNRGLEVLDIVTRERSVRAATKYNTE
jgi:hypothetical protein